MTWSDAILPSPAATTERCEMLSQGRLRNLATGGHTSPQPSYIKYLGRSISLSADLFSSISELLKTLN
ncbi:hypothetical protein TNCT_468801 [Trichonephila clavata]|uniref:Uncharacterized protein n=1 Tax=Trichonephila clavata TaxID=2740835 RepID=A0A8X6LZQ9_TRICU|nr:hypothetical protein TNCT_468801 [Trichonephila clavata]